MHLRGTVLWRKRFAPRGGHPAVAFTEEGSAEVAFYEAGRVRVAAISRDGVGTTSTFARVTGDQSFSDSILGDYRNADIPKNERVLLDYAWKLSKAPGEMTEADIDGLPLLR